MQGVAVRTTLTMSVLPFGSTPWHVRKLTLHTACAMTREDAASGVSTRHRPLL